MTATCEPFSIDAGTLSPTVTPDPETARRLKERRHALWEQERLIHSGALRLATALPPRPRLWRSLFS